MVTYLYMFDIQFQILIKIFRELLDQVKRAGKYLVHGLPQETVAGNMVRRILCIIRAEYVAATKVGI